jgi:hypothetical protein
MGCPAEPTRAMLKVVADARLTAAAQPPYTGFGTLQDQQTISRCRHLFRHGPELGVSVLFTRDDGMHACGWWKNPDYSRCEHLSLAFHDVTHASSLGPAPAPQDHLRARLWCLAFFREHCRLLWVEPPFSPQGKRADVYHYRLFLAPDWRMPVLPRKEVYTREFTERGWKSWSDQHSPESFGDTPP